MWQAIHSKGQSKFTLMTKRNFNPPCVCLHLKSTWKNPSETNLHSPHWKIMNKILESTDNIF